MPNGTEGVPTGDVEVFDKRVEFRKNLTPYIVLDPIHPFAGIGSHLDPGKLTIQRNRSLTSKRFIEVSSDGSGSIEIRDRDGTPIVDTPLIRLSASEGGFLDIHDEKGFIRTSIKHTGLYCTKKRETANLKSIELVGDLGLINLYNSIGRTMCIDGEDGSTWIGGNGRGGRIVLHGHETSGFTLNDTKGTIYCNGEDGSTWIGGNGRGGRIVLHGHETSGREARDDAKGTIYCNGEDGSLWVGGNRRSGKIVLHGHETSGREARDDAKGTINFDGQGAHVYIGGNNRKGKLLLFNDDISQSGRFQDHNATIQLDAHEGVIRVKGNSDQEPRLIIDGKTGNCETSGDILFRGNGGDCAEEFPVEIDSSRIEPGTVMIVDDTKIDHTLTISKNAYDKRVIGVVSGAGDYNPAIILDKKDSKNRVPVALIGKVFCKVDASYSPIEIGDLLTTSNTPGCAMKAMDPCSSFGSIIGKALKALAEGIGIIPILVGRN